MAEYIDRAKIGLNDFEIIMCDGDYKEALKMLLQKIEDIPAADVQPVKHGRWVLDNPEQVLMHCSNCNWLNLSWKWKYCPNCGAKMDGAK